MPEYLSPGVYVEEVEGGTKSVEGVSTSTAAFLGESERGPVKPTLVTGFGQFRRRYGRSPESSNLAIAIDGYFRNGGNRCYVGRITPHDPADVAKAALEDDDGNAVMEARAVGPGEWGNTVAVIVEGSQSNGNGFFELTTRYWSVPRDEITDPASDDPDPGPDLEERYTDLSAAEASSQFYEKQVASSELVEVTKLADGTPSTGVEGELTWLEWGANSRNGGNSANAGDNNGGNGDNDTPTIPDDDTLDDMLKDELVELAEPFDIDADVTKSELKSALQEIRDSEEVRADGGADAVQLGDYQGHDQPGARTGLAALKEHDDISIVCVPDEHQIGESLTGAVVDHCENMGERFAILSAPQTAGPVSDMYAPQDSTYAAYYYPWIETKDPLTNQDKTVPPTGHVAGIYARNDTEQGVHGAPANMVVRGALDLQLNVTKGEQDILNPRGVNCIRSFQGRGIRVWGARTCSSDPEWRYINVRRLFLYIRQSIDEGTQWAVFEPNDRDLWARVRQSISNFLTTTWRDGALMGTSPDEAFYVKCGESTMTQDDIDNGRLICEIGIAPVKPAEFIIFRIQQWTEGAAP